MAFTETVKRVFGLPVNEYDDDYQDEYMEDDLYEEEEPISTRRNRYSRRTTDFFAKDDVFATEEKKSSPIQMVLVKAKRFADAERIAENLKQRRSVIVNFDGMEAPQAQRTIDYLSGTTFAMSGTIQRVSQNTFVFAVGQVDLIGRIEDAKERDGYFSVI